jgi:hypothetical protein
MFKRDAIVKQNISQEIRNDTNIKRPLKSLRDGARLLSAVLLGGKLEKHSQVKSFWKGEVLH